MTNAIRFAVLSLMTSAAVSANPPTLNAPPSVAAYLDQVAAVDTAGPRVSLEPVYNAALAAQDDLMTLRDDAAWIEGLSDADFAVLQSRLRGFALSRGLEIYADPDPAFFRALADTHGQPADQAFFAQLEQSTAPDYLPVYLRPKGLSVCVRYGDGLIAPYYAGWLDYQRQSPERYKSKVNEFLANLEGIVGLGTCACGALESVQQELHAFTKRFPSARVNGKIRDRLAQLEVDPWSVPVRCS